MARLRADLHPDFIGLPNLKSQVRKIISQSKPDDLCRMLGILCDGQEEISESKDGLSYKYNGEKCITTLSQALDFCKVDLEKWQVKSHKFKSWDVTMKIKKDSGNKNGAGRPIMIYEDIKRTNYGVSIDFEPKQETWQTFATKLKSQLKNLKRLEVKKVKGTGTGIFNIADLHTGADIKDLVLTPDFNINILAEKLQKAANKINESGFKKVYVNILGDLVESVSGLNHPNTWKSIGENMYGHNVIIMAYELIKDHFLSRINNLVKVNMLPGNHDRFTIDSKVDNVGGVAGLLAYFIRETSDIEVGYNDMVVVEEIDGINYILLHGHHSMVKNITKLVADYGRHDIFNVVVHAHLHSRKNQKTTKQTTVKYNDVQMVHNDELNYRAYLCPSIFTGNFYSESIGHASTSGLLRISNNGEGKPNSEDFSF